MQDNKYHYNLIKVCYFISTGCYIGLFPIFPGTIASIVGFFICLNIMFYFSYHLILTILILLFFLSIKICNYACVYIKEYDHKSIVLDEIIGIFIVTIFLPQKNYCFYILGIILFRFFDILKPWPICYIDNSLKGGKGIIIDDIIASIFSILVLYLINIKI